MDASYTTYQSQNIKTAGGNGNWIYIEELGGWVLVVEPASGPIVEVEENSNVRFKVLGVTDLLIVEQKRVLYCAGEIAHIENVLSGESFKRTHRKFIRTDELIETEVETTEENERDIQSSEKFELEKEVSQILKEERKLDFGAKVSASYGPTVKVETEFGMEDTTASEQSQRSASRYTNEVTERAINRIRERVRELRQLRTISETEEASEHGIERSSEAPNLSGVYQWIDKIYQLHTMNYGKRLMLEAVIPEPGAYLRYIRTQQCGGSGVTPPEPFTITSKDIDEDNYTDYASIWLVGDLNPPPPEYEVVGLAAKVRLVDAGYMHYTGQLKIPNGYRCIKAIARIHRGGDVPWYTSDPIFTLAGQSFSRYRLGYYTVDLPEDLGVGELPITVGTWHTTAGGLKDVPISITAICKRTDEAYTNWQIETYNTLLQGYLKLKSEHEESVASLGKGVNIQGSNPNINRENELEEVRKMCIELMVGSHIIPQSNIQYGTNGSVHIDFNRLEMLAIILDYFEDLFEWENVSYELYPYYWGGPSHVDLKLLDDPDLSHLSFLRAGAARVKIPVRVGYERNVLYFLDNGQVYREEGPAPIAEERLPLMLDIEQFITNQESPNEPIPYGEPWLARVPTTFVTLSAENGLPQDWIQLSTDYLTGSNNNSDNNNND